MKPEKKTTAQLLPITSKGHLKTDDVVANYNQQCAVQE